MSNNGDKRLLETPNKYVGKCCCGSVHNTNRYGVFCRWVKKHQGKYHNVKVAALVGRIG